MKRKSEQFGHKSFLGQNCPESKLQKRAFIKLIFIIFCDFRIDKGVHELLGHPLYEILNKIELNVIFLPKNGFETIKWFLVP